MCVLSISCVLITLLIPANIYIYTYKDHPEFNLCTEGMCVYKTDMLNVQLYLQGVNFLPRLHTDWFKYRVSEQSFVMCSIPCQVCALVQ